jgi:hypothetical protein
MLNRLAPQPDSSPADYPIHPVEFTRVSVADRFWLPRLETNRAVTIPYNFQKCEETGRIRNFDRAAGRLPGPHEGLRYNDSDVHKVIEGAAYSLSLHPDPDLEAYLDDLIARIAAAQEDDGYLFTARTIDPAHPPDQIGPERWSNLSYSHELYNAGHLLEAAVAHYQATGKPSLLDVALLNADLIDSVFGPGEGQRRDVPGHQEIEIGLVKLTRVTGDERYLRLAKFFLDERGHARGRELYSFRDEPGYMQDHLPVIEQDEAVGHAVRATYMYSGMADVAALTGDQSYIAAITRLWDNVVSQKLYLTGGIGARGEIEGFGAAYDLPNATAYNETCAAIGAILWNHRLFLLTGEARYLDVLERTLYNGFLAGVSFGGDTFFYPNPLEADGITEFNGGGGQRAATRLPWFRTSCCPTNVARFLPSLPGYVYATDADTLYVNLFVGSSAAVSVGFLDARIDQDTRYPWDGAARIMITPQHPAKFTLAVRIPGWARGEPVPSDLYRYADASAEPVTLAVNGKPVEFGIERGFARLYREWNLGDVVDLTLPMPVRRVGAHDAVEADRGRVALERGPLVYCVEGVDHGGRVDQIAVSDEATLVAEPRKDLLNGVYVIRDAAGTFAAIPYYAWSHRGVGPMAVWLKRG